MRLLSPALLSAIATLCQHLPVPTEPSSSHLMPHKKSNPRTFRWSQPLHITRMAHKTVQNVIAAGQNAGPPRSHEGQEQGSYSAIIRALSRLFNATGLER